LKRSVVLGCGSYLPAEVLSNEDISKLVDTTDEWITARTGIKQRHRAAPGEFTSDLAREASIKALDMAGIPGADLDLIVLATSTPNQTFPATATVLQNQLGMRSGAAFDVQAVCSGFIYALTVADNFIRAGQAEKVLVVGAETFTRILDWTDRTTCVLFGDGAGAIVLSAEKGTGETSDQGVLTTHLHSDGRHHDLLYVDGGPSSTQSTGFLRMEGKEVFRHAVTNLAEGVTEALEAVNMSVNDIDWVVPHQANKRIIDSTVRKLRIPPEKVVMTVSEHGNTSAASVPLALDTAVRDGRIKRGDLLLMEAMGGGLTWGSALVRW